MTVIPKGLKCAPKIGKNDLLGFWAGAVNFFFDWA